MPETCEVDWKLPSTLAEHVTCHPFVRKVNSQKGPTRDVLDSLAKAKINYIHSICLCRKLVI